MASIHRPLGYGPSVLPLHHTAFTLFISLRTIYLSCVNEGGYISGSCFHFSLFAMDEATLLDWMDEHLAYEWLKTEWDIETGLYTMMTTGADGSEIVLRLREERGLFYLLLKSYLLF